MKLLTVRNIIASAALISSSVSIGATPIDGWYGSLFGGYAYIPNNISDTHLGLTRTDASYKPGFDAGGSFGFKANPLRYEAEVTYINAKLNRFRINHVPQIGKRGYSNAVFGMANVYYDFPIIISPLQPFLGVGIGYGWVNAKLESEGPFVSSRFSNSDTVFAYQGTAGLTYDFAENYALNLGYRYIGTDRVHGLGKVFQAHLGNIGVIYRFCDNNYK